MRPSVLLLALCALLPVPAFAQTKPGKIDIKDAATLIGKTLDEDTQYAAGGPDAARVTVNDWSYGFAFDDPGLQRLASTKEGGKGTALLSTVMIYNQRCKRTDKAVPFAFDGDERFPLKGSVAKGRRAEAWVHFSKNNAYEPAPTRIGMTFSENDGALYFKLDPAQLARYERIALCPTAAAPDAKPTRCAIFSLAGFVRAYDFVCDAR